MGPRKLCLVMVDALRRDMLERAASAGTAPHFAELIRRGEITDCVAAFPSVTPVCCSEIATGESADRHWISGINWYHRVEERYVEYGSSLDATRAFGLFRTTHDIVYNMNMAHLSPEVETVFESLADLGVRTACTPFLIFRGRSRHELGLEGMLRRGAQAAGFRHAVWGPDEFFYGELFSSRPVPCRPTLARPGTRDEYSACVATELVRDDAYDFMLLGLPDNDHHAHRHGPEGMIESIAHADACFGRVAEAAGGLDRFLGANAVILMADHGQSPVTRSVDLPRELGEIHRVLGPADEPHGALGEGEPELAVSPIARAAAVYVLGSGGTGLHREVREWLCDHAAIDLCAWAEGSDGEPLIRAGAGAPSALDPAARVVVRRGGASLRFKPSDTGPADIRGRRWSLEGDLAALELGERDGALVSDLYPDALARLWSAVEAPHSGEILASLAPGWECSDWGGAWHRDGGSHGALDAVDSTGPLLFCGFPEGTSRRHAQWRLTDVAGVVREHFGDRASSAARPELRLAA